MRQRGRSATQKPKISPHCRNSRERTHPEDATGYRPGVVPGNDDGQHANDMRHRTCTTLRIAMEFPPQLRNVREIPGPCRGDW